MERISLIMPLAVDEVLIPAGYILTIVDDRGEIVRVRWGRRSWNMSRALFDYATGRREQP